MPTVQTYSSFEAFLVAIYSFTVHCSNVFIIHSRSPSLFTVKKLTTSNSLDCDITVILAIEHTSSGYLEKAIRALSVCLSLSLSLAVQMFCWNIKKGRLFDTIHLKRKLLLLFLFESKVHTSASRHVPVNITLSTVHCPFIELKSVSFVVYLQVYSCCLCLEQFLLLFLFKSFRCLNL